MLQNYVTNEARVRYRNVEGNTLLHMAVNEWRIDLIDTLIDAGINVNTQNMLGKTAILFASQIGYDEAVLKLYERGADIELYSNDHDSPLLWAIYKKHNSTAELLLLLGANPYHKYYDDRDAFAWAVKADNDIILRYLLKYYPVMNSKVLDLTRVRTTHIMRLIETYKREQMMAMCTWVKQQGSRVMDYNILREINRFFAPE